MVNICETCPNNKANSRQWAIGPGEAKVFISRSGSYELFSITITDGIPTWTRAVVDHPTIDESYPELAESMSGCTQPEHAEVSLKGVKRLLGLLKGRVPDTCPALATHLDVTSAAQVQSFFAEESIK